MPVLTKGTACPNKHISVLERTWILKASLHLVIHTLGCFNIHKKQHDNISFGKDNKSKSEGTVITEIGS